MTCVADIFDIRYGHSLELNRLRTTSAESGIAFVSRKSGDNGIAAYVERLPQVEPAEAGEISCALSGNGVLTTCLQEKSFYTAYHVAILRPKVAMDKQVALFYCLCISANRFRYSYGRQANKTLASLSVPAIDDIPPWVFEIGMNPFAGAEASLNNASLINIDTSSWRKFRYDEVFSIKKGFYNKKPPVGDSEDQMIPFIGATESRNGITSFHSIESIKNYGRSGVIESVPSKSGKIFPAHAITVANNGASVGNAFYQPLPFTCSHDVNPLYLLDRPLTADLALFICTVIKLDRYRWSYGRKWRPSRMPQSSILLPVQADGTPDWQFMESFINTLPYSATAVAPFAEVS